MRKLTLSLTCLALFLSSPVTSFAQTPQEKGFEIAARSDRMDKGFGTSLAKLEMILTNKAGQSITRELEIRTMEKENEQIGDKQVTLFFTPPDVEGTALLSHAKILKSDDQWLYLPELARVKRISSSNKSGPFVGSEFAFEDLTASELMKYDYTYLKTQELNGMTVDVVEWIPRYKRSGYSRMEASYDQDITQLRQIRYFNRGGAHLKTLTFSDYREYGENIWRAHELFMENHLTGKTTTLRYNAYQFGVDLDENEFKPAALTRM